MRPEEKAAFLPILKARLSTSQSVAQFIPQKPTERQALFLSLKSDREVFYGGAAGGGKSSALLMGALEYVNVPNYSALLLRRTYADLSKPGALMDRAAEWLRNSSATWNEQRKQWTFPSGAKLTFGYLESENDKFNYQSAEYQFIAFDELSQFSRTQYLYLFSRLRRLEGSQVPLRMRSGSNPGGVGGRWVYDRFIPEGFTPFDAQESRIHWKEGTDDDGHAFKRAFVPARLHDNPHLDQREYVQALNELDPVTREQLLQGDWQIQERGDILTTYSEAHSVITWSHFQSLYGTRHIPTHWLLGLYQDAGMTEAHPCVTSWFATAPKNVPKVNDVAMTDAVYLYRGLTVYDWTTKQRAEHMNKLMAPHREQERVQRWQHSHEAADERVGYRREHNLPFNPWPTGKTRGVAQLRTAFELRDVEKQHPFKPDLTGHPLLYLVVDDDQYGYPKNDAGLARHRAEIPAYHWAVPKSGDPPNTLIPYSLFNDAIDTLRAAAADYWPNAIPLTDKERAHQAVPEQYRVETFLDANNGLPLTPEQELAIQFQETRAKRLVGKSGIVEFTERLERVGGDEDDPDEWG